MSLMLLTGCASLDPLGSVVRDPETGERDLEPTAGVVCRELTGRVSAQPVDASGRGLRCLEIGNATLQGCLRWGGDGAGFSYESAGCFRPSVDKELLQEIAAEIVREVLPEPEELKPEVLPGDPSMIPEEPELEEDK